MLSLRVLSLLCCAGVVVALLPSLLRGVLFSWHPLLMIVGYIGLMTDGILSAHALRTLVGEQRVAALQFHGYTQTASTALVALGFLAIYKNKGRAGKSHITTPHAKLGLVTLAWTLMSIVLGASSFRKYGIITIFPLKWQGRIKKAHRLLAVLTWLMALWDMQLPLPHPVVLQGFWCRLWQAGVAALALGVLATLYLDDPKARQAHRH